MVDASVYDDLDCEACTDLVAMRRSHGLRNHRGGKSGKSQRDKATVRLVVGARFLSDETPRWENKGAPAQQRPRCDYFADFACYGFGYIPFVARTRVSLPRCVFSQKHVRFSPGLASAWRIEIFDDCIREKKIYINIHRRDRFQPISRINDHILSRLITSWIRWNVQKFKFTWNLHFFWVVSLVNEKYAITKLSQSYRGRNKNSVVMFLTRPMRNQKKACSSLYR